MSDRNGYIGRAPGDSSIIIARKTYEPTGVQTDFTFSAGYTPGYCDVYLNGVKLITEKDYTASNGSTVGLTSEAQSGDIIEVVAYKAFNLGVPISDVTGNLDVTGNISASSSITADGAFYGDGSNLSGIVGAAVTQYIAANSLTVLGSPGVSTITRLGVTDAVVTGIITANGLSGNVTGAACTFTTGTFSGNVSIAGSLTYEDVTNVDSIGVITARSGIAVTGGEFKVGTGVTIAATSGVATFAEDVTFIGAGAKNAVWDKSSSSLDFVDDAKANFGTSNDLSIYHNGSHSYIHDSGTGDLRLTGSTIKFLDSAQSENMIAATESDSVDIYFNNSKKWETTNDGTKTTGIATATVGIDAAISVWTLGADGTSHYTFTGPGNLSTTNDPTLNLIRGQKYTFKNRSGGHPFRIQSTPNGSAGTAYNTGVTNNDGGDGTNIIFDVPYDAPAILYYQCTSHGSMGGEMYISGSGYETKIGAGITFGSAGVCTFADGGASSNALKFGSGGDLIIYHDGSNSMIDNNTGNLNIQSDGTIYLTSAAGSEVYAQFSKDGAASLRYDNSTKLATTNDGVVITGIATATGAVFDGDVTFKGDAYDVLWDKSTDDLKFPDNASAKFGTGNDLSIYHNGTDSYISNDTGHLILGAGNGTSIKLQPEGGEDGLTVTQNGSVEAYYDNSKKIETCHEGIMVSGMCSVTTGIAVTGGMLEGVRLVAGKLSDNTNIDLADANIWYFSTQESTTSTPNLRWDSSTSLAAKVIRGEAITVTIITTAAAGGYSANLNIDGGGQTEEWNGGSAPSAGGDGGYDVYTHTIYRKVDGNWLVLSNVSNFA